MKQILQTYKWNILWAFISCPLTGVARRCEASRGRQQSATMSFAVFLLVNNTFVSRNIVHGVHCHCMPSCVDEGWEREQKMDNGPVMAATVPSLYCVSALQHLRTDTFGISQEQPTYRGQGTLYAEQLCSATKIRSLSTLTLCVCSLCIRYLWDFVLGFLRFDLVRVHLAVHGSFMCGYYPGCRRGACGHNMRGW